MHKTDSPFTKVKVGTEGKDRFLVLLIDSDVLRDNRTQYSTMTDSSRVTSLCYSRGSFPNSFNLVALHDPNFHKPCAITRSHILPWCYWRNESDAKDQVWHINGPKMADSNNPASGPFLCHFSAKKTCNSQRIHAIRKCVSCNEP